MEIKTTIKLQENKGKLKAYADVEFDKSFAVKGITVVEGSKGLFLNMPSKKGADNEYYEQAFPVTRDFRNELTENVLAAYSQELEQTQTQATTKATKTKATPKATKAAKAEMAISM
jgi:stage V sporulation protein G